MISLCSCTGEGICNCPIPEIAGIYTRNRSRVIPKMDDLLDLLDVVKVDIDNMKLNPYAPYWEFMEEVLYNIESGKWHMHPYVWVTYITNGSYIKMPMADIIARRDALRNKCINMLRDSNLPIGGLNNKQILLRWVRNPNGFQDIMSTAKTIITLNELFRKGN